MWSEAVVFGERKPVRNARLVMLAALIACAGGSAARGASPSVITDCSDDSQLQSAVAIGGEIVFACSGTISNGSAGLGGAMSNHGTSIVSNCTFLNNRTTSGPNDGGAILSTGTLIITNSTFANNSAGDGGAIYSTGTSIITNSTFSGNSASLVGGIYNGGSMTLENTVLSGSSRGNCTGGITDAGYNLSDDSSCGFTAAGSQNSVTNLNLGSLGNNGGWTQTIAPGAGSAAIGAIPAGTNGCGATVTTDQTGAARPGNVNGTCTVGAVEYVSPVAATITDCTDDSQLQSAVNTGGRIVFACSGDIPLTATLTVGFKNATLDATGQLVTLDGQNKTEVFAIFGGALTLNNLTIQKGISSGGGAIDNEGDVLTITNCTLSLNSSPFGGAIFNDYGTLTVANSTFSNNTAPGSGAQGRAIWNAASLMIANSTFSGNNASGSGSTGGAIFQSNIFPAIVANSTFSGNSAATGGGLYSSDGVLTSENTIVAGNTGGNCALEFGTITDGGYNLDNDGSCGFSLANHSFSNNQNANLGTLSNNGGPTQTIPFIFTSAAIDVIPIGMNGCGRRLRLATSERLKRPRSR